MSAHEPEAPFMCRKDPGDAYRLACGDPLHLQCRAVLARAMQMAGA